MFYKCCSWDITSTPFNAFFTAAAEILLPFRLQRVILEGTSVTSPEVFPDSTCYLNLKLITCSRAPHLLCNLSCRTTGQEPDGSLKKLSEESSTLAEFHMDEIPWEINTQMWKKRCVSSVWIRNGATNIRTNKPQGSARRFSPSQKPQSNLALCSLQSFFPGVAK